MCLDAQGGIEAKRQPFLWLLECGLVDVCWWSKTCSTWLHPSALVRVSCLPTTLDSRSLECENTYTPARRVALFYEHFVAPTASAGCVLFYEILRPTSLDQHDLHLVRNLIALFLLAACSVHVYLVHPDAGLFHSQEIALLRMLSGTAALSAALEKLPRRSLW